MEYAHGLNINVNAINKILDIAYSKDYLVGNYERLIDRCDNLRFNEKDNFFEFYFSHLNICIKLEKNKFIECYTIFLNEY